MLLQRPPVLGGTISLVFIPLPTGIIPTQISHDPIAVNLGNNRGCRDGEKLFIRLLQGQHRASDVPGIHVVRHDDRTRLNEGSSEGAHGKPSRFENVHAVDQLDPHLTDQPVRADGAEPADRFGSQPRAQTLGVADGRIFRNSGESRGADDHWTGQGPATNLVDTDDEIGFLEKFTVPVAKGRSSRT